MTASTLRLSDRLSKFESWRSQSLRLSAPLRDDEPINPADRLGSQTSLSSNSTKHTQALYYLRQTYSLERRCFL